MDGAGDPAREQSVPSDIVLNLAAGEILRENNPLLRGTQRGDVYSFSVICYEIMNRSEPYNFDTITPRGTLHP